jgi:hypothetical protein
VKIEKQGDNRKIPSPIRKIVILVMLNPASLDRWDMIGRKGR